ncbi:MAG: hypothetical protein KAS32_30040 [Candidatus Peribacteraceae bacterium]|nr:hypothetical protein [Candidatus Peribacteraceae bacterium]
MKYVSKKHIDECVGVESKESIEKYKVDEDWDKHQKTLDKAAVDKGLEEGGYRDFFRSKLKKYGVSSPTELSPEKKKKMFDEIEKEWTGEKE